MKKFTVTVIAVYAVFALSFRHGRRCLSALAGVFAKQKLQCIITAGMLLLCAACATAKQETEGQIVTLDQAIREAARTIENDVQAGQKIAVLNFTSPTDQFSEYVIDELSIQLAKGKKFVVVDRRELELIRQEEQYQLSGEVSDESAQSIGKKLGAQLVISGSLTSMGNAYRFRIRALNVESAAVETGSTADLSTGETKIAFMLSGAKPAPVPQNAVFKIGDRGPAGGLVFYDKGNNNNGWRYMEAAPTDLQTAQWGLYGEDVSGTGTGIGDGKRNTELIIAALNRKGESGKAAQLCRAYTLNGYNDWFLPSRDELDLMYKNLRQKGIGNFKTTEDINNWTHLYWSSSQGSYSYPWYQNFSDDYQTNYTPGSDKSYSVRAVRAF